MKYTGMPVGMWILFSKSFEQNLVTVFGLDRYLAGTVKAKAKPKYKEIIAGLSEFEKADRFKMNIVNCALLAAFVLNMPERPDVERLTAYYAGSMMTPAMKWFCRKSGKSKFTEKDIFSMKAAERLRAADRNPYSWSDCGYKKKRKGNGRKRKGIPIRGIWSFFLTRTAAAMKRALPPAVSVP